MRARLMPALLMPGRPMRARLMRGRLSRLGLRSRPAGRTAAREDSRPQRARLRPPASRPSGQAGRAGCRDRPWH